MPNRLKIAIVAAVFFGFIAAYSVWNFLRTERERRQALESANQDVVVAAKEISPGTTITKEVVKLAAWPKASLPPGSFPTAENLIGKVIKVRTLAGEPITEAKMTGEGMGMTVLLSPGHRAIAVRVDEIIGVSGFITPNDRVDVISILTPPGPGPGQEKLSKIVLQNKRVLSVAQTLEQKEGKPQVARSINLEVTPEEAEKLSLATLEGAVILALRAKGDERPVQTQGSTKRDLLAITAPQKGGKVAPPQAKHQVEVYMGSQKSVQEF